jgi:predicted branched-subunit amino acid permease
MPFCPGRTESRMTTDKNFSQPDAPPPFCYSCPMSSSSSAALAGVRDAFPMALGVAPLSAIFGTLVVSGGLPPELAVALSAIVFAGSAQLAAIGLIGVGAALPIIWLTTFVINLRHVLYSATLQPATRNWPLRWRIVGAFGLTDQCFAGFERRIVLNGVRDALPYYFGLACTLWANWVGWTAAGAYLGHRIPGIGALGLDFALIATFVALVAPRIRAAAPAAVAAVAGSVAWFAQGLPYKLGLLAAALCGIAAGALFDWRRRRAARSKA